MSATARLRAKIADLDRREAAALRAEDYRAAAGIVTERAGLRRAAQQQEARELRRSSAGRS